MTVRPLIDLPDSMALLPRDDRGYPVPEFVRWINGKPDFRILKLHYRERCVKENICWLCGGKMGTKKWFVLGPMCTVTRTTSEPPSHKLCAEFAVKNCPFLTMPLATRSDKGIEHLKDDMAGVSLQRNPGASAIWMTTNYQCFEVGDRAVGNSGWLITVGEPLEMTAWARGRKATRKEFMDSIESGFPAIMDVAEQEGPEAVRELKKMYANYLARIVDKFLPKAVE